MRRNVVLAAVVLATGCELLLGADFDDKTLRTPADGGATATAGASSSLGGGGAPGGGGAGGTGLLPNGSPCTDPSECESGFCPGVCCASACAGDCGSCVTGTCVPTKSAGESCELGGDAGRCDAQGSCATGKLRWLQLAGETGTQLARACAFDPQGNLWVVGSFEDVEGPFDLTSTRVAIACDGTNPDDSRRIFVAKLDAADGTVLTAKVYGSNGIFEPRDLAVDPQGNGVALVGSYCGQIEGLESPSAWRGIVLRLDAGASTSWVTDYSYSSPEMPPAFPSYSASQHVAMGPDSEVVVAGTYAGTVDYGVASDVDDEANAEAHVASFDAAGSLLWHVTSDASASGIASAQAVAVAPDGAVILTGLYQSGSVSFGLTALPDVDPAVPDLDLFVVRYDGAAGAVALAKGFGSNFTEVFEGMALDGDGRVMLSGSYLGELSFGGGTLTPDQASTLDFEQFTVRLETLDGGYVWGRAAGPFADGVGPFLSAMVAVDASRNPVVAGRLGNLAIDLGTGEIDPPAEGGWFLWKSSEGDDAASLGAESLWAHLLAPGAPGHRINDVAVAPDGSIAVCGMTDAALTYPGGTATPVGTSDVVVAVFDP